MTPEDFDKWLHERNRILVDLDTKASGIDPEYALISLHKARYECTSIKDDLRHER